MSRMRAAGRTVHHPARYSPEVTTLFRFLVGANARVHDPFAGTGEKLLETALTRSWHLTGTEIEPEFIVEPWVVQGDATDPATYPRRIECGECGYIDERFMGCTNHHPRGYVIMTSPVYPNGMADSWNAKDASKRRTYRTGLAQTTGVDRQLHENNMGRWGYRHGVFSTERRVYWSIAERAAACWNDAEAVLLNVSDFMAGERRIPIVHPWRELLHRNGWQTIDVHRVPTKRYGMGANRDVRVDTEIVLHAYGRGELDPGQSTP